MHNILLDILEIKKKDLVEQKKKVSLEELKKNVGRRHLSRFKQNILSAKNIAIIAEIKLASPANPSLGSEKEMLERAKEYKKAGASAISCITEPHYFKGKLEHISELKRRTTSPILQKDFVIDNYQIYQAKLVGSDALLLIARYVELENLNKFVNLCLDLHIEPIVELNNEDDLEKAISTNTNCIAVNARNLEDFSIDVDRACTLIKKLPNKFIKLGFSGIHSFEEVKKYKEAGVKGVLVGTELMRAKNIKAFIQSLHNI